MADALDAFLGDPARRSVPGRTIDRHAPGSLLGSVVRPSELAPLVDPLVIEDSVASGAEAPLHLPHPDWLYHQLDVVGQEADIEAFQGAAAGAGTIPWLLDLDRLEEDWFHRLIRPEDRTLSLAGARLLATQLREAVERRQAVAVSRVGRVRACSFDLHALVPVPVSILRLGPDHPGALAWLWQHWGTTDALRHVARGKAAKQPSALLVTAGERALRLSFWSADWTPWRALERIRADWPALRFDVRPDYAI